MMSQFLLKGHKMLDFLFAFLLKISETLKAHISATETDIDQQTVKSFPFGFQRSYISANKKISKTFDA